MGYRFIERGTGTYQLASGTLGALLSLSDVRAGTDRGDGGIGTLSSTSGVTAEEIYNYFTAESRADAFKADVSGLDADVYFANIKYVKDITNNQDEYGVQWFKNDQPIVSSDLTTPGISLYNTSNGNSLFEHQSMSYVSPNLGVVRYDSVSLVASGEPYLVVTSGVIDSNLRVWRQIVGLDWF